MFKCCVCNKSSKKEKPNGGEVAKSPPPLSRQSQKASDCAKPEANGGRCEEKLNGDVQQRLEKVAPSAETVVDDLTVKSPLPSGKRDEASDGSRSRSQSMAKSNDDADPARIQANGGGEMKEASGNGEAQSDNPKHVEGGGGGMMEAILNSAAAGSVKTNLYDSSSAYIERTIDDGPDEEGDDSVFEACPNDANAKKPPPTVSSVPRWLSEEEDGDHDAEECSGMQEPPATPVARDELALRRHRFFSDLLQAAQNATEHRVRFDPLGPMVHAGCEASDKEEHLEELVNRLENVTKRLEKVKVQSVTETQDSAVQTSTPSPKRSQLAKNKESASTQSKSVSMSIAGFANLIAGPVKKFLEACEKIGGDVATQSVLVAELFQLQYEYLEIVSSRSAPMFTTNWLKMYNPMNEKAQQIHDFSDKRTGEPFSDNMSAIATGMDALGWVTVKPDPAQYVKEMREAGEFYIYRILRQAKETDKEQMLVEWCKAWRQMMTDLEQYVRQHHPGGLKWKETPPPLPSPPPRFDAAPANVNDDRSALFAQINQGEAITKNLKKVTSDMQTHKNPALRTGPEPYKAPVVDNANPTQAVQPANDVKPPVFKRDGKKWLVEHCKGRKDLLIDNAEMDNVIYMFRCLDSTLVIEGKVNSVIMDSCLKSSIVFHSVVSSVEFVNCRRVEVQVLGKVPTIAIDKTDGCQIYLNPDSLDVVFISSKSSEMNVMVPGENGDYTEHPIPEQFKTTIGPKGLSTVAVNLQG